MNIGCCVIGRFLCSSLEWPVYQTNGSKDIREGSYGSSESSQLLMPEDIGKIGRTDFQDTLRQAETWFSNGMPRIL